MILYIEIKDYTYMRLIFSLVLYNQPLIELKPLFSSIIELKRFFKKEKFDYLIELYITDNGNRTNEEIEEIEKLKKFFFCDYYRSKINLGFGKGNNKNFERVLNPRKNDFFVIINPDISFIPKELIPAFEFIKKDKKIVCVAPLIKNKKGNIQYSVKRNPTLLGLFLGRFNIFCTLPIFKKYMREFKSQEFDYTKDIIQSTYLSGCFLITKIWAYSKINGFDETFFLHLEDADIVRRLSYLGKTLHYPFGIVTHRWARGSHHSIKQIFYLISSMINYFKIWGFRIL